MTAWDVETGVAVRTYSCDAGFSGSSGLTSGGGGGGGGSIALCLLRESHLLCAPRNLPFIYVWHLQKVC